MFKDSKIKEKFPTWAVHLLLSLSTIGLTLGIVWLSPGVTIAPLLVEAFRFGLFVGVGLVMASVSALSLTPFALAAIYFSIVGALVGAGIVGLSVGVIKMAQAFRATQGSSQSDKNANDEASLTNSEENKGLGNMIYDFAANIGVSSSLTAVVSIYFPNLLVAAGIIPTFLSGMIVGILAIPFFASIETLGVLALPFAAGGLLVSSLATGLSAYFMIRNNNTGSNENTEDNIDSPSTDKEFNDSTAAMKKLGQSAELNEERPVDVMRQGNTGTSQSLFGRGHSGDKKEMAANQSEGEARCCSFGF